MTDINPDWLTEPHVTILPTAYEVAYDTGDPDWDQYYRITVEYRDDPGYPESWAITNGKKYCLARNGDWHWELSPSNRDIQWLKDHRYNFTEAIEHARRRVATMTVGGLTAEQRRAASTPE